MVFKILIRGEGVVVHESKHPLGADRGALVCLGESTMCMGKSEMCDF